MIFSRLFPLTPNWFLNMACGLLGVDLVAFSAAIAIGLAPYNFLTTKAGVLIGTLASTGDIFDGRTTLGLAALALVGVAGPPLARRLLDRKAGAAK